MPGEAQNGGEAHLRLLSASGNAQGRQLQLSDIFSSVRRHWRVSVAILLLAGVGLGLFLFNRKVVRGSDRWEATVEILVPVRGKDGQIPAGVPPSLLYGQSTIALSHETTANALKGAGLDESHRGDVTFSFAYPAPATANNRPPPDILTLSAIAPNPETATKLADSFASPTSPSAGTACRRATRVRRMELDDRS